MWQAVTRFAILDGAAVICADKKQPYSAALSLLLAIASWVTLFWTSPAAFACGLVFGLGAVLLGVNGYSSAVRSSGRFRSIFGSTTGTVSGLITSALALLIWALVWPEVSARQAQQEEAHALLASIARETNGTTSVSEPRFSKPGGIYADSVSITFTRDTKDTIICYTLDGSEPTTRSLVYTRPINLNRSATVSAKAFRPSFLPSSTVFETYLLTDRDLTNFTSNLPLVVINTAGRQIMREPHTKVFARFISPAHGRSRVTGPADYTGAAEMHLRGSSTLRFPKRSYTISTDKQKASIFGFPKDSDWVLYAPYQDKTLMRDVLAYELSRDMGHYSSRTRFVELFINTGGGRITRSDYQGVYVFEEKVKRGKNRVNVEALTRQDNSEPNITGGYIFKRDHNDRNENGFYTRNGGPYYYVYPKEKEITPAQKRWLHSYMDRFETALYGPNFMDPERGYRAFLDVDSFIDQHWLIEMSKNVDGFRYSVFLHKDRGGKLKLEPVWDWNLSFGNADYYGGASTYQWYNTHLRSTEISWFRRLRQDPDFMQRCVDRWGQLRTNEFSTARIHKRIDQMAAELQEAQGRNFDRWGIMGQRVHANSYVGRTYRDEVTWMKRWIKERLAWIDTQLLPAPRPSIQQADGGRHPTVVLEGSPGTIYYTLDGTDPREPGGGVSSKAKSYSGPIAVKSGTQIFARSFQSQAWSHPVTVKSDAPPLRSASLQPRED